MCFSSCVGGLARRPVQTVFTLESGGKVYGRQSVEVSNAMSVVPLGVTKDTILIGFNSLIIRHYFHKFFFLLSRLVSRLYLKRFLRRDVFLRKVAWRTICNWMAGRCTSLLASNSFYNL